MHQSIPAAPNSPPGYCGAFARLVSPGGGTFANFALPARIQVTGKTSTCRLAHLSRTGKN